MSLKCIAITHTTKLFCSEKVERRHMWSSVCRFFLISRTCHTQILFPCDKATKWHVQTDIKICLWENICEAVFACTLLYSEVCQDEILIYLMWAERVQQILQFPVLCKILTFKLAFLFVSWCFGNYLFQRDLIASETNLFVILRSRNRQQ